MLLQAYDFVHLNEHFGCELQVGGSDQWGNITAGIDLARRMHAVQLYGITCPLLTKSDGAKMGKTEAGALWLSPRADQPVPVLPILDQRRRRRRRQMPAVLHRSGARQRSNRSTRPAPPIRASAKASAGWPKSSRGWCTATAGLATARRATEILFGAEIEALSDAQLGEIFADVPSKELPRERLRPA